MATPYQYIVLHQSCRKYPGVAAAQAAHAAAESIRRLPVSDQTHVCVLVADTSDMIESLATRLAADGVHHVVIREPDAPYNGAAVALGMEPQDRERIGPYVEQFKVFR